MYEISNALNVSIGYFLDDLDEQTDIFQKLMDLKRYIRKMAIKGKGVIDIEYTYETVECDFAELKEKVDPSYYQEYDKLLNKYLDDELEDKLNDLEKE